MDELLDKLDKADRLSAITQRLGFAVWQLQELESVCATYFVLLTEAEPGMGTAAGNALEHEAKKKTFGNTIRQMKKAGLIDGALERRFYTLLAERNWLIHRSRADSRNAIYHDEDAILTIQRIEKISKEALSLVKVIGINTNKFMKSTGIPDKVIQENAARLLEEWHTSDASEG